MNDTPGTGHNQPPDDAAPLLARAAELTANANAWLKDRPEIATAEQAAAAQLFVDQIMQSRAQLDGQLAKDREPHELAIVAIRAKYRTPMDLLDLSLAAMRAKSSAWLQKQKDVLVAEQGERERTAITLRALADSLAHDAAQPGATVEAQLEAQRAETAAVQAEKLAGKKPKRAAIKGDFAAKAMTLHTTWHARITDETKALKFFCKQGAARPALLAVAVQYANKLARSEKSVDGAPPGVEFYFTEAAR